MLWTLLPDADTVAQAAAGRILSAANRAIGARGVFHLVLAGGRTPEAAYRLLAGCEADWSRWHLWFGDERCLPPTHPERNSRMAALALAERVPIPPGQVHPIPAELGPEEGARRYAAQLAAAGVPPFDLVLLGLGEDGHTASLFPGHLHPGGLSAVPVHDAPKPPPERVSLSAEALSGCRGLLFLVTGAGKRNAVSAWRAGEAIPAAGVRSGAAEVLIDQAAWTAA